MSNIASVGLSFKINLIDSLINEVDSALDRQAEGSDGNDSPSRSNRAAIVAGRPGMEDDNPCWYLRRATRE